MRVCEDCGYELVEQDVEQYGPTGVCIACEQDRVWLDAPLTEKELEAVNAADTERALPWGGPTDEPA